MKVLVTFAFESELAPWRRVRSFVRLADAEFPAFDSRHGDSEIRAVITGMGAQRAQRVARTALEWQPDVCIAAGFVGGLNPAYRAGDVLVATNIRDGETQRSIAGESRLVGLAEESGARRIGTLLHFGLRDLTLLKTSDAWAARRTQWTWKVFSF